MDTTKYPERGCDCVYCRYARARGYGDKEPAAAAAGGTDWWARPLAVTLGCALAGVVLLLCLRS